MEPLRLIAAWALALPAAHATRAVAAGAPSRPLGDGLPPELARHLLRFVPGVVRVAAGRGSEARMWECGAAKGAGVAPLSVGLRLDGAGDLVDAKFFPDGERLLTLGARAAIVWGPKGGALQRLEHAHGAYAVQAEVLPDGRRALTLGSDGRLVLWDVGSGRELRSFSIGVHEVVRVLPDGDRVVSGVSMAGAPVAIWSLRDGVAQHLGQPGSVTYHIEVSASGRLLATTTSEAVWIWSLTTLQLLRSVSGAPGRPMRIAICPRDSTVAFAHRNIVFLASVAGADLVRAFPAMMGNVVGLGFLRSGRRLVALSSSQALVLDVSSAQPLLELAGDRGDFHYLAVSPGSDIVAVCGNLHGGLDAMRVQIWHAGSGQLLRSETVLSGVTWAPCSVAASAASHVRAPASAGGAYG